MTINCYNASINLQVYLLTDSNNCRIFIVGSTIIGVSVDARRCIALGQFRTRAKRAQCGAPAVGPTRLPGGQSSLTQPIASLRRPKGATGRRSMEHRLGCPLACYSSGLIAGWRGMLSTVKRAAPRPSNRARRRSVSAPLTWICSAALADAGTLSGVGSELHRCDMAGRRDIGAA